MKSAELISLDKAKPYAAALRRGALPILSLHTLRMGAPGGYVNIPAVYVDTQKRSDVRDLPRIHQTEGPEGDTVCTWQFVLSSQPNMPSLAVLDVKLWRPVRCKFRLCWDLSTDRAFLTTVARVGLLTLTTVDPRQQPERATEKAITLTVPTGELREALAIQMIANVLRGAA